MRYAHFAVLILALVGIGSFAAPESATRYRTFSYRVTYTHEATDVDALATWWRNDFEAAAGVKMFDVSVLPEHGGEKTTVWIEAAEPLHVERSLGEINADSKILTALDGLGLSEDEDVNVFDWQGGKRWP